ncbi:outer membrane protein [Devosia sp. Root413D1]|uniref:outer membrane protein n=1 Tax=Devosia sp. Root413D1 TaxID=1736531 RepID=UPI0006F42555|nr:outer membrane beta-barrel protein [Devosia sp. Root413D1]
MTLRLFVALGSCALAAWVTESAAGPALWSGPYVGAFVGYGIGNEHMLYDTVTFEDDPTTPAPDLIVVTHHRGGVDDQDINGLLFGGVVGFDASLSEVLIAGIAADIAVNNVEASGGGELTYPYRIGLDWHASLRGRIGLVDGNYLPYFTGGLALGGGSYEEGPRRADATHLGWTLGAGIEAAISDKTSIDAQYRYSDYGLRTYVVPGEGDFDLGYVTHTATIGVNWHF